MAIGGLAGLTLAGLTGGPQGFMQGQQQQDQLATNLLMNRLRTKAIEDAQREDQARALLFSSFASPDQSGIAGLSSLGSSSPPGFSGAAPAPPSGGAASAPMGVGSAGGATGQPTSLLPSDMRIPASGPLTAQQAEAVLPIIKQDESSNRNIMQTAYSGAPGAINPSTGTHTPPSTASGYEQFTNTTWRIQAPKAGVDINQYPTAMSAPQEIQDKVARNDLMTQGVGDWAPWNKRLAAHLGLSSSDPVAKQAVDQATSTAQSTASTIPQMAWGRMSLTALAQQIDKANPGADPVVKMMALEQANKLLAPAERNQWQLYLLENRQQFQQQLELMRENFRGELAAAAGARADTKAGQGGTIVQQGGKTYQIHPDGTSTEIKLGGEGPVTRLGAPSQGSVSPETQNFVAQGIANYQLPPLSGWAMKTPAGQQVMAKVMELNPDYQATQFTGKQSGARTVGTRSANLTMATNVAEELIPLVKQTSHAMDSYRTQFPNLNAMVMAVEKGTGDENVVRFMEQINTLKYAYAKALNPTGVARVEDLKRYDDILNQAWTTGQIDAALDQMERSLAAERRGVDKSTGGGTKGGAAPAAAQQPTAVGPDGKIIHYDGKAWVDEAGNPVQ